MRNLIQLARVRLSSGLVSGCGMSAPFVCSQLKRRKSSVGLARKTIKGAIARRGRDTPEVVGEFAEVMHPRMIGLTGSPEQVKGASQAYKTYYKAHDAVDDEYLVDHSTFSYLVMPEDGFVEFFRRDVTPEAMADSIGCFVDRM